MDPRSGPAQPGTARIIYRKPSSHSTQPADEPEDHTGIEKSPDKSRASSFSKASTSYKPLWLRLWVLVLSFVFFLILFVALIFLRSWSTSHYGFALSITNNQYAWKYGPTAILVFMVTVWRQVDYFCKATMPWQLMARGYTPAERSLLLDYLWPMQFQSLQHAARSRDLPVIASITGFILLKLTVFASTGLLVLLPTRVPGSVPLRQTSKIDGSQFWMTVAQYNSSNQLSNSNLTLGKSYLNLTDAAASAYHGSLTAGIHTGLGNVVQEMTIPMLQLALDQDNIVEYTTNLQAFSPSAVCEPAQITFSKGDQFGSVQNFALDTPECSVGHWDWENSQGEIVNQTALYTFFGMCPNRCPPHTIAYIYQRVDCADEGGHEEPGVPLNSETEADVAYMMFVANVTNENPVTQWSLAGSHNMSYTVYENNVVQSSAVLCRLDYHMVDSKILRNTETRTTTITRDATEKFKTKLPDLSGLQLGEILYSIWDDESQLSGIFDLMTQTMGANARKEALLDIDTLRNVSQVTLKGLANYFISTTYMTNDSTSLLAEGFSSQSRLEVGQPSFWLMLVASLALMALTVVIIWTTRGSHLPREMESIGSLALLLSSSSSLRTSLRGTGGFTTEKLADSLKNVQYTAWYDDNFQIAAQGSVVEVDNPPTKDRPFTWIPYPARKHAKILTLSVPILAIAALELAYRLSLQSDGLFTVTSEASVPAFAVKYSSTLLALSIATLFNALDFLVVTVAPYHALRSDSQTAASTILVSLRGRTPFSVLYRAVRRGHVGVASSSIASIIGSTLTVIVSGVWYTDTTIPRQSSVSLSLSSSWTTEWANSSMSDNGAAKIFDDIQHGRNVAPPWILKDVVLPNITFDETVMDDEANYTFILPALRPQMDCDIVSSDHKIIWNDYDYDNHSLVDGKWITSLYDLPEGCLIGPGGNESVFNYTSIYLDFYKVHPYDLDGGFYDFVMGPAPRELESYNRSVDNPPGCPSKVLLLDFYLNGWEKDPSASATTRNTAALVCYQRLQQVLTEVTFTGDPSQLQISNYVVDESSVSFQIDGADGSTALPYMLVQSLFDNLTPFGSSEDGNPSFVADKFLDHLFYGPNPLSLEDLGSPKGTYAGINETALLNAVQKLYNRYMLIAAHRNLKRDSTTPSATDREIKGSRTSYVTRMKVDNTSKIILQVQLAVMVILCLVTYSTVSLEGILPGPPTSIGAVMSLLADSDFCDPQRGVLSQTPIDVDGKKLSSLVDGWFFSIGWWGERVKFSLSSTANSGSIHPNKVGTRTINSVIFKEGNRFGIDVGKADVSGFPSSWQWARFSRKLQ